MTHMKHSKQQPKQQKTKQPKQQNPKQQNPKQQNPKQPKTKQPQQSGWFDKEDAHPRGCTFAETQAARNRGSLVCDKLGKVRWVHTAHLCSFSDLKITQQRKFLRSGVNRSWKAWHDKCIKTETLGEGEITCMRTYAPPDGTISLVWHVDMCMRVNAVVVNVIERVAVFASASPIPDVFCLKDIPEDFVDYRRTHQCATDF